MWEILTPFFGVAASIYEIILEVLLYVLKSIGINLFFHFINHL